MHTHITEDGAKQSLFRSNNPLHLTIGILFITTLLVTLGNLIFPESSALHVSDYTVSLLGKYLCYALLALAVDLVWGYCGILSLGHGAFFTLGLCHGHVPDAPNWRPRGIRQS
jgi:urea transport system permease protein